MIELYEEKRPRGGCFDVVETMKKYICLFLALLLALAILAACGVSEAPQQTVEAAATVTVYVTDTGEKYHRENCTYLISSHAMPLTRAKSLGYTPCSRCNPPR